MCLLVVYGWYGKNEMAGFVDCWARISKAAAVCPQMYRAAFPLVMRCLVCYGVSQLLTVKKIPWYEGYLSFTGNLWSGIYIPIEQIWNMSLMQLAWGSIGCIWNQICPTEMNPLMITLACLFEYSSLVVRGSSCRCVHFLICIVAADYKSFNCYDS